MLHQLFYISLIIILLDNHDVGAFNLSPVPNVILNEPLLETKMPQLRPTYFGYSLVLRENSILIAAPQAQSTLPAQGTINEPGAIYKCPLTGTSGMATPPSCFPFVFDDKPNIKGNNFLESFFKDFQWLGAAMDGGPKEIDNLLICAPKFAAGYDFLNISDYMHGMCFWTMNTLSDKPRLLAHSIISPLNHDGLQTKMDQNKKNIFNYQLGEAGFSAHITPNNLEFLIGAPGIESWKGSVIHYNKKTAQSTVLEIQGEQNSYTGYAVASGYLDSAHREKVVYVVTIPHAEVAEKLGEVRIFDINESGTIEIYAKFQGLQYGEFFGYAVLVEDINGDGLDDVLVTAPLHSIDGLVDVGAVHVFLNKKLFTFTPALIKSPFSANGRFGTTIIKLGDINLDGYNDIAISAPFASGVGKVVIYLGGPEGLRESQILQQNFDGVNSTANMFGHGISKGVDFDSNGYNDFAVGAPGIGRVYIYRAYPVVEIIASINSTKPSIDLSEESEDKLVLKVCYHIVTNSSIIKDQDLILTINVDSKIRRLSLLDSKSHTFEFNVKASLVNQCKAFNATIKYLSRYVFEPIVLEVTHTLRYDGRFFAAKEFCAHCAVVNPMSSNISRNILSYHHGCKNEVCEVDLKFIKSEVPEVVLLGNSRIMSAKFVISNGGEKAFDTTVTITTSLDLPLAKLPSYCEVDIKKLVCKLGQGQAFTGTTNLQVDFDVSSDRDVKLVKVKAVLTSAGKELVLHDNVVQRTIELRKYSVIEVNGQPFEAVINLNTIKTNLADVSFTYEIHNSGPSCISQSQFRFTLPVAFNDFQEKNYHFIDVSSINLHVFLDGYNFPTFKFALFEMSELPLDPFNLNHTHFQAQFPEIYKPSINMPTNRSSLLNCATTAYVFCADSVLTLPLLETGRTLRVQLKYKIDRQAMEDFMGESVNYIGIMPDVFIRTINEFNGELNITKSLEPNIFMTTVQKTSYWTYILAVIGGILVLILLTLALVKLGFFKRQTKDDMEKLIMEKEEVARMKSEIEKLEDDDYDDIDLETMNTK